MAEGLSVNQTKFITWLIDPRGTTAEPQGKGSQANYAKILGVDSTTLSKWKKMPQFIAAWEKRHAEVTGGIQRYSEIMEQLRKIAMGEVPGSRPADMRAAAMNYFELVGRHQPKKTIEIKDVTLLNRSDDELMSEMKRKLKVIEGGKAVPKRRTG